MDIKLSYKGFGFVVVAPEGYRLSWWHEKRGFGFLCSDDDERPDIFIHALTLLDKMRRKQ